MFVQLIANLGMIVMDIYLLFKLSNGFLETEKFSKRQTLTLIVLQTLVGVSLLGLSAVYVNTRVDFRFLLNSISMKYLGWQVTVPMMFLVALARFFFDHSLSAWVNLIVTTFVMATLPFVYKWAKRRFGDFGQWMSLITYSLTISLITLIFLLQDWAQVLHIGGALALMSYSLSFIAFKVLNDLQGMLHLVNTDNLTQLHNARKLQQDIILLERSNKSCSVIVLDIDNFKKFNDTYGHAVGDIVLKEVAKALSSFCEGTKRFYRTGGEEFVVILSTNYEEEAMWLAEKIRLQVQNLSINLEEDQSLKVTVSVGVSSQKESEPLLETIRRADNALYDAKSKGRNQIAFN